VRSDLGYLDVDAGGLHTVYWFDAEGKHPGQVDEVTETLTNGVMDVYVISLREEWEPSAEQRAAVFHTCPISEGAQ
jgi:hypothetical protein